MKKIVVLLSIFASQSVFAQLPTFTLTDKEVTKGCTDAIAKATEAVNVIGKNTAEPSFENTVIAMENAMAQFDYDLGPATVLS